MAIAPRTTPSPIRRWLLRLLATGDTAPVSDGIDPHVVFAKEAAEASANSKAERDKLAEQLTGKSLTAAATTVVGYLGITRLPDVYPIPAGWDWLLALTYGLLAVMLGVAASIGWRFQRAKRRTPITLKPDTDDGLSEAELADVLQVYSRYATVNHVGSLAEYSNIGLEIERAHEQHKPGQPAVAEPLSRATQIRAEVQCAQQMAATNVLRRRTVTARSGFTTMASIVIFVLAGLGVFVATDKLDEVRGMQKSQDSDRLTTIKDCAAAMTAKTAQPSVTLLLPTVCTEQ